MAAALGLGPDITRVQWIGGGIGSSTHAISFADGRSVVIKRYPSDPASVRAEWERLSFAHGAALRVPEPLGVDTEGDWFGSPTVVMARMPGRADLNPSNPARYGAQVVDSLAEIHSVAVASVSEHLLRPHTIDTWTPPDQPVGQFLEPRLADDLLAALAARHPWVDGDTRVFNHGDFHPGNLLWSRGRLTGVVDWSAARVGYAAGDVAYFANEAELLFGFDLADAIERRYEAEVAPIVNLDSWRLWCAYASHRFAGHYLVGWHEQGRRDLTLEIVTQRLTAMTTRLLGETDG